GERRMDYAQAATKALSNSLLGKNTAEHPDLIRMSLISFSNTAEKRLDFTTDNTTFNNAVDALPSPDGGTNWEYALQLANEMAVESDRATFVIFVTDGNPTFRQTRGVLNNGGTGNLEDNDLSTYYYPYNVYGTGNSDIHGRNYAAALAQARSIVGHSKNFYTIGISNDVTNLTKLTTEAGAGADHSKTATSNEELVAAFDDIAASIIALMGHSDIQITDGITDLTQTVQKSAFVSFAEDDFTYYKGHAATAEDVANGLAAAVGDTVWESWTPSAEGCAEAVYNTATGAVEWNMGAGLMLEDGYTYQVRFKVWPSQAAYDLLADLNNGVKSYDTLSDAEKAQISEPATPGGMYTLRTNSETSYTYREATKSGDTVTPVGEPSEPGSFPEVDPLELTTKPLKVQKQWHNNYVDSRTLTDSITMELYGVDSDGVTSHDFKEITLTAAGNWYAENNYISYGLVTYDTATNSGAKVYETGHDFTLRETDDEAHYYELEAGIYRPMFNNGTPTILERIDAAPSGMGEGAFHYSDGS
ncbi:MAG: VWA domain-containing protein, partial [Oscillospiraceae bacterium]|nr:VWA domain-containing protein [Oscillospiraceae bacterium]